MSASVTALRRPGREPPAALATDPMAYAPVPVAAMQAHAALLAELSRVRPTMAGSYTTVGRLNDAVEHLEQVAALARQAAETIRRAQR